MSIKKQGAFTLVELIVVISVLAILATITFSIISNITLSARNSTRLTDVTTVVSQLEMRLSLGKYLPKPENGVDLIASGSVVGYQGNFGINSARTINLSEIKDPKDNTYYTYTTDNKFGSYQILGFKENDTAYVPINTAFADSKISFTKGDILGILLDTTTKTPIEKTNPNSQIDIVNTSSGLTAIFSDTKQLSGTGFSFGGSMWSLLAKQANFNEPISCPTGFIPVSGNIEFNQPGFCIMKYEAKVAGGAANSSYNSHNYSTGETIVSNAADVPVVNLSQTQAIAACKSMGAGYHLVTNNEWMTLARNTESVGSNWSSGIVGSGYMYSGHNDQSPYGTLAASVDDTQGYINTGDTASASDGSYGNYSSDVEQAYRGQRRTLKLSNEKVIWDLAGDAWEHVNKANTLNGSNFDDGLNLVSNACGGTGWFSFYYTASTDTATQCAFKSGYSYANI